MPQYPIPQFIEAEGKITPFLTFRQFFWLVGGAAFCILFYYIFPTFLFYLSALVVALFIGMVAFVKINDASVMTIFRNFITFKAGSKNYTWKKNESAYPYKIQMRQKIKNLEPIPNSTFQTSKLTEAKKEIEFRK